MLLLFIVLIITGVVWSFLDRRDGDRAMKEFCDLECRQNIKSKYMFCC